MKEKEQKSDFVKERNRVVNMIQALQENEISYWILRRIKNILQIK